MPEYWSFYGRRRNSSAPPGMDLVFYMILAGCVIVATVIAYYIGRLFRRLLKVKVGRIEASIITTVFLLSFWASSLVLRQREDGMTIYFYGSPTPYQGAFLYYGFPSIWYRMFEPYDPNFKSLFTTPSVVDFGSFFIDLVFWLTISVIVTISVKYLITKRPSTQ